MSHNPALTSEKLLFGLDLRKPNGIANNLLDGLAGYNYDQSASAHYDPRVRDEIAHGVRDLRSLLSTQHSRIVPTSPFFGTKDKAMNSDDPILRDQAVWSLVYRKRPDVETLIKSIEKAPEESLAVSALLALQKAADADLDKTIGFLTDLSQEKGARVNLGEWAVLLRNEIEACRTRDLSLLKDPVSSRKPVHLAGKVFDLTMPLLFQCNARTTIAGVTHQINISPTWFKTIFGDAMACIRNETFESNLVLEKNVMGLHADGSSHFEHFPFTGTTTQLNKNLFLHNYWSQIFRPYYPSGRVEMLRHEGDVIQDVPMTFARVAVTAAYDKYAVNDVALPESVRGIFFGYGHIPPRTLLTQGLRLRAGDFQISSRLNPETGKPANTYFYGTFFGKLTDTNEKGELLMNGRATHCDKNGALDYSGCGHMDKDPVRPEDWR